MIDLENRTLSSKPFHFKSCYKDVYVERQFSVASLLICKSERPQVSLPVECLNVTVRFLVMLTRGVYCMYSVNASLKPFKLINSTSKQLFLIV